MIKNFFKNHSIHKKIVPYMDYIFLFKPTKFFLVWVLVCIGMYIAHTETNPYPQWLSHFDYKTFLLFLSLTLIFGSIFIKELIVKSGDDNSSLKFIDTLNNYEVQKYSIYIGFLLLIFVNLYNLVLGAFTFFLYKSFYKSTKSNNEKLLSPMLFLHFCISFILILSGYCLVATNGSYFIIGFNLLSIIRFFIYSLCSLAILLMINSQCDEKNIKSYSLFATLLILICFILGIYLVDPLLSICTLVSMPFFLYALFRKLDKDIIRSIRYPVFIFNFFVSTIYPYLSLVLIIVFYISKYYNWHKYNIHFPTFLVNND